MFVLVGEESTNEILMVVCRPSLYVAGGANSFGERINIHICISQPYCSSIVMTSSVHTEYAMTFQSLNCE